MIKVVALNHVSVLVSDTARALEFYHGLLGLPVTGFAAYEFENEFLDGVVKANYGGLFQHKGNVRMGGAQ